MMRGSQARCWFIHFRRLALLSVIVLACSSAVSVAKELEDMVWIEARTANFKVRSVLSEKDTVELARYLETFRVAVSAITNIGSTESPIPTHVYVFRKRKDFAALGLDNEIAGIMAPGLRNYTILIRDVSGMKETSIVLHEYVHFLMRNRSRFHYPKWFDEGFAEYLSAARIRRNNFEVGLVPEHRVGSLRYSGWINLSKIIDSEPYYDDWYPEQVAMFYAESWALVHYLQNGREGSSDFSAELARYIELVEKDQDHLAAFEDAFGMSVQDANRAVKRYLKRGRFSYLRLPEEKLMPDFQVDTVRLTRAEVSLGLGQLALRRGKYEMAARWFAIAAENDSTRAQAKAGIGDVAKFSDNWAEALPHFEEAVAIAPDDLYVQLDMADYWHRRARKTSNISEHQAFLERAREHYVKAWKINDAVPETYAMYGDTFLLGDPNPAKAIEMLEEAHYLLPSDLDIRLRLAEAYILAGRTDDAKTQARSVLAWGHDGSAIAERAREIITELNTQD